jgi:hypothetical protein
MSGEQDVKRKNHQVTRGYLANWSCKDDKNTKCIWYINIEKQKVLCSQGEAAGFAVSDWLYVPKLISGNRDPVLENWFAGYERDLCKLARISRYGRPKMRVSATSEENAIKGCINLGFRSKYSLDGIASHYRTQRPELSEEQTVLAALQTLHNASVSFFEIFRKTVFTVAYNLPVKLVLDEDPFHISRLESGKILGVQMALSPTSLMFGLPDTKYINEDRLFKGFKINWLDGAGFPDLSNKYNRTSINGARQWLVCSSKEQAQNILPDLSTEKVAKRALKDRVFNLPLMLSGVYRTLYEADLPQY